MNCKDVEVIVTNLSKSPSGVSTTLEWVAQRQQRYLNVKIFGFGSSPEVERLRIWEFWRFWSRPSTRPFRVWHARRNIEMLTGIIFRDILRMPLRLVFTSASQRTHSKYSAFLIGRMDAIIATSQASASYLQVPNTVIHHGIDLHVFSPVDDKGSARQRFDLPDKTLVGCFGRVRKDKGTDLFVHAMISCMQNHKNLHAVIAGLTRPKHRELEQELRRVIDDAGLGDRFHWLGNVHKDDMPDLYRTLNIYVAPQRWEGFGVTPLEAMASGIPVVATHAGTFKDQVAHDKTGLLVEQKTAEALAAATTQLLSNETKVKEFAINCRMRMEEHFDIDGEARAINAVYQSLWP